MKHISLILVFIFLFPSIVSSAERCEITPPPCFIMVTDTKSINVRQVTHVEVIDRTVVYHLVNRDYVTVAWPTHVRAPQLPEIIGSLQQACRK